ncbi:transposase, partial [Sphingomonas sp. SRS2]
LARTHLVNAATVMMAATKTFSSLKDWGVRLSKKIGFHKARIAVARKLAIIMFGLWRDGTHFQFKADTVVAHREMMQAARG